MTVWKRLINYILVVLVGVLVTSTCLAQGSQDLRALAEKLENYDGLSQTSVLVLGTYHFDETVLSSGNQKSIKKLIDLLANFQPTKVVLEWEPEKQSMIDEQFTKYVQGSFSIDDKKNEVYQLGFRLAKRLELSRLHLFDDQTEFDGSLTGFSFDALLEYAKANDKGFYDKHEEQLINTFSSNEKTLKALPLYEQIALRNSPQAQHINSQRMHLYENRIGIQGSWLGPDWLGRWYRRNVRMSSNVLKFAEPGDRILIIVGDNHKWVLDYLFEQIPEFQVESSWELFLSKDD